jgi:tRNA-dihydrouridine synthase 2
MGCPKHFSLSGGMGAALLSNPTNARKIIESVRAAVNVPVTCKIRIHENVEDTISFCKLMVESGVAAIAIHGRTAKQRPQHPNQVAVINNVSSSLSLPVIAK